MHIKVIRNVGDLLEELHSDARCRRRHFPITLPVAHNVDSVRLRSDRSGLAQRRTIRARNAKACAVVLRA